MSIPPPKEPKSPATAPPEPDAAQGEYNPRQPEAPLRVPALPTPPAARHVELLAPAGGPEAGYAALHAGADAVYLGLRKFSARADAENFTIEQLDEITAYAHSLTPRRRVLAAINTLVLQHELGDLVETLAAVADIGVDALLVQDLGVLHIARKYFPELELHASTQLAVHNRAGAEVLRDLGFKRVILARELTFDEIREIAAVPGIESEVFIHGALCYAYSGLCLLSSQTLSRSGNRGRCAYACRDSFRVSGAPARLRDGTPARRDPSSGFPFSMKDLALPDFLSALRAAGVSSFKIEGRKKNALYVATVVAYYRDLLDGRLSSAERPAREADLQTVFSRPWTRLFIQSHRDKEVADRDTTGHRGARIGAVARAVPAGRAGRWVSFTTARRLEFHDGLQVDVPGLGQPFGFAIGKLRLLAPDGEARPRSVFEAPAGARIAVALPFEHPALPAGAPVYCSASQAVKQRYRFTRPKPGQYRVRRAADFEVTLEPAGLSVLVRAACGAGLQVRTGPAGRPPLEVKYTLKAELPPAQDAARTEAAARTAFQKLADSRFALGRLVLHNPQGRFASLALLNQARRQSVAALEAKLDAARGEWLSRVRAEFQPPVVAHGEQEHRARRPASSLPWSAKVDRCAFLDAFEDEDWEGLDEVLIEIARDSVEVLRERLASLSRTPGRERIRLALPALTRKWEEGALCRKIAALRADGWDKWEAANLSAWRFLGLRPTGTSNAAAAGSLSTDWSVYVVNRVAARQVLALGATRFALSPEDGLENVRSLLAEFGSRATLIVYQDTPQFLAESCAYANLIGGCPGKPNCLFEQMGLTSSYGEKLLALDYHCRTIVVYQEAFCIAPFLKELAAAGAVSARADFVHRPYTPEQVREVWRLLRAGKNVPHTHTACFAKGML
jgi:putative protease